MINQNVRLTIIIKKYLKSSDRTIADVDPHFSKRQKYRCCSLYLWSSIVPVKCKIKFGKHLFTI